LGTGPSRVPGSVLERGDDLANNRPVSMTKKNYRVVTAGLEFPEGPIAMSDGSIILVEIKRGTLTRVLPSGAQEVVAELGGGPNGIAIGPGGKCYVCNNGGFDWHTDTAGNRPTLQPANYSGGRIEVVDLDTGVVEVLYTEVDGVSLSGPNDIVFDGQGGFYFSDLGKVRRHDQDRGRVLYAKADGSFIGTLAAPVEMPNGVGLSPDESTLYVAETPTARLWAFDLIEPGRAQKQAWPSPHGGRFIAGSSGYQRFDSLAVEEDGRVCVATLVNGGISIVSPDTGSAEHIPFPDPYTTNICFGGDELRMAYITLSQSGQLIEVPWPRAGLALNYLNK